MCRETKSGRNILHWTLSFMSLEHRDWNLLKTSSEMLSLALLFSPNSSGSALVAPSILWFVWVSLRLLPVCSRGLRRASSSSASQPSFLSVRRICVTGLGLMWLMQGDFVLRPFTYLQRPFSQISVFPGSRQTYILGATIQFSTNISW